MCYNILSFNFQIEPDKLIQFKKIDKLESFMRNIYELVRSDNFTSEMAEGLQNMIVEEFLPQDDCSDAEDFDSVVTVNRSEGQTPSNNSDSHSRDII